MRANLYVQPSLKPVAVEDGTGVHNPMPVPLMLDVQEESMVIALAAARRLGGHR